MARFTVFIDENAPDDIQQVFAVRGYETYLVRERFGAGTPDQIVAKAADEIGALVVTYDTDYKRLAGWTTKPTKTRYPKMHVIVMSGVEPLGAGLIDKNFVSIEHEYDIAQSRSDQRLLLEIGPRTFSRHDPTG